MKKKFSWRAFISFGLTYAIVIILLSGIMLYVAPPGRYAHWVNWTIWGFSKEGWQAIHTIFSFGFVILSIFHLLSVNWKTFVSYLKSKTSTGFNKKREFIVSTLVVLIFFFGTIFSIPPFKTVMNLGEHFTDSWEKVEDRAPVPHAEQLTLTELSEQMNLESVDEITRKLDRHKIKYDNVYSQKLQDIGLANKLTPAEIYEIISKKTGNQQQQGSGIGRKTMEDYAAETDKSVDDIMEILKANNIDAKPTETLRVIAENNNMVARDIYKLISE